MARVLFFFVIMFACAACALVLGIEDKPLRQTATDVIDTGEIEAGDADAGPCIPVPQLGCRSCERHDFCDDFDDDAGPFARWESVGGFPNPFLKGKASITIDDGGFSPDRATRMHAEADSGSTYALVFHRLPEKDAAGFGGVHYSVQVRVETLSFIDSLAGPVPDAASAYIAAIMNVSLANPEPIGAAILLSESGVYLAASTNILETTGADVVARIYEGNVLSLAQKNWFKFDLYVTDAQRAAALGFNCNASNGPVAAARIPSVPPLENKACIALPDAFGNDSSWANAPVIGVGAGTFGAATVGVRHDNVMVDLLE